MSPDYLSLSLEDGRHLHNVTLFHHDAGALLLPSGRLVACDPFVVPGAEPFVQRLRPGTYPVVLSIAKFSNDQRVAFATLRLRPSRPITWEMLVSGDQQVSALKPDEIFGYSVDSGTGCFMDRGATRSLVRMLRSDDETSRITRGLDESYQPTWSWVNSSVGDLNIVAFSSGGGDGAYATYAGFDNNGEISIVVTDFDVI